MTTRAPLAADQSRDATLLNVVPATRYRVTVDLERAHPIDVAAAAQVAVFKRRHR